MAKFRNVSPIGALDIPALGRVVQHGEVFETTKELASYFESQPSNFEAVREPRKPKDTTKTPDAPPPVTDDAQTGDEKEESR